MSNLRTTDRNILFAVCAVTLAYLISLPAEARSHSVEPVCSEATLTEALESLNPVDQGVPDLVFAHNNEGSVSEHPVWVSADAALSGYVEPAEEVFHKSHLSTLRSSLRYYVEERGCFSRKMKMGHQHSTKGFPQRSLSGVLNSAQWVLMAQVVGSEFGFLRGEPHQVFRLKPLASTASDTLQEYFVGFKVGEGESGGHEFCLGPKEDLEDGLKVEPQLGDWLVITSGTPEGSKKNFSEPYSEVIFGDASETIVIKESSFAASDYVRVQSRAEILDALIRFAPRMSFCARP